MKGPRTLTRLLVCALVLFAAIPAMAQNRKNSFELNPWVGRGLWASDLDVDDSAYYGIRAGWNFTDRYELEVGLGQSETDIDGTETNTDIFTGDMNITFNYPGKQKWHWVPYFTVGSGVMDLTEDERGGRSFWTFNYGGGVRWFGTPQVALRVDLRGISALDQGDTSFAATVGLSFVGGGKLRDTDGDTVPDYKDRCPGTPLGCIVDKKGCPLDGDADGICDGLDKCPDTPKGCKVDTSGCSVDPDGDGVCEPLDACPDTPRGCTVDAKGCPSDADADTVCDGVDACPATPKGCTVDERGCPKDSDGDTVCDGIDQCNQPVTPPCRVDEKGCVLDEDADGVCDALDKCPGTPRGTRVDASGCETALVIQSVQFDFDKAVIKDEFKPTLDKVAQSLTENPSLRMLLIGHTDNISGDEYNMKLGLRRAQAVKDYLAGKGVAPGRLEVDSKGEKEPIADNATEEGRYRNRRTEFKRLQ